MYHRKSFWLCDRSDEADEEEKSSDAGLVEEESEEDLPAEDYGSEGRVESGSYTTRSGRVVRPPVWSKDYDSLLKLDYTQTHHTCVLLSLRGLHVVWIVYFCLDGGEMLHVHYLSHMYMCIVCVFPGALL